MAGGNAAAGCQDEGNVAFLIEDYFTLGRLVLFAKSRMVFLKSGTLLNPSSGSRTKVGRERGPIAAGRRVAK